MDKNSKFYLLHNLIIRDKRFYFDFLKNHFSSVSPKKGISLTDNLVERFYKYLYKSAVEGTTRGEFNAWLEFRVRVFISKAILPNR